MPSVLPEGGIDMRREVQRYRWWLIEQALVMSDGNYFKAARLLGITRSTLYKICPSRPRAQATKEPTEW